MQPIFLSCSFICCSSASSFACRLSGSSALPDVIPLLEPSDCNWRDKDVVRLLEPSVLRLRMRICMRPVMRPQVGSASLASAEIFGAGEVAHPDSRASKAMIAPRRYSPVCSCQRRANAAPQQLTRLRPCKAGFSEACQRLSSDDRREINRNTWMGRANTLPRVDSSTASASSTYSGARRLAFRPAELFNRRLPCRVRLWFPPGAT